MAVGRRGIAGVVAVVLVASLLWFVVAMLAVGLLVFILRRTVPASGALTIARGAWQSRESVAAPQSTPVRDGVAA